jgi:hypothetical protein
MKLFLANTKYRETTKHPENQEKTISVIEKVKYNFDSFFYVKKDNLEKYACLKRGENEDR